MGDSICNGKYIEFLDAFDRFISTEPSNSNYVTNRDNVYNLIGQYKAKKGVTIMAKDDISKIVVHMCHLYQFLDKELYAEQINMLYGAIFQIRSISTDLEHEIIELEKERIRCYGGTVENTIKDVVTLIREYSKWSFYLAERSFEYNKSYEIAKELQKVFTGLVDTKSLVNETMKNELRVMISETELDFLYAAGNHAVSSLRLAPIIRDAKK